MKRATVRPTLLLTGFDPFDGAKSNPSWDAASALDGRIVGGHRIVARQLPTEFDASLRALRAAIRETAPSLVVCLGLAGGRKELSLERVAINIDDARIPDNAGAQPVDAKIAARGPAAYFSTLPIKAMLAALRKHGIPAQVSQTAGTYVCNHVFYGLMHALRNKRDVRGGFIHVPNAGRGGMPLEDIAEGLRIALRVAATTNEDARIAAGAED
ncbi:pyroglutamyl-peptidase I [Pseudoluteimonas lycopersici]|uniref:pyroglutamyl-peptidase I n=1 Tax=Pseudoluteimonas lycopersici TaxID=1324796 RepID=UPI001FEB2A10|nr:pyroglutamyl-peptidase I [Lysobacter lycopersici]